jgi:hypothetical protein
VADRDRRGPFGLIVFTRPRLAATAVRLIAPGPRVRLGRSQRLGRQPDAVGPPPAVSAGRSALVGQAAARPLSRHG